MDKLYTTRVGTHFMGVGVFDVSMTAPPFGCNCYMLEEKGIYRLARTEGSLVSVSCTHVGAGAIEIIDGACTDDGTLGAVHKILYKASPQTMCLWILNAGFSKGLVVRAVGGDKSTPVFLTLSWLEKKDGKTS